MVETLEGVIMDASYTLFRVPVSVIAAKYLIIEGKLKISDFIKLYPAAVALLIGKYTKINFILKLGAYISSRVFEKYNFNSEKYLSMLLQNINPTYFEKLLSNDYTILITIEYKGLLKPFIEYLMQEYNKKVFGIGSGEYLIGLREKIEVAKYFENLLNKNHKRSKIKVIIIDDMIKYEV